MFEILGWGIFGLITFGLALIASLSFAVYNSFSDIYRLFKKTSIYNYTDLDSIGVISLFFLATNLMVGPIVISISGALTYFCVLFIMVLLLTVFVCGFFILDYINKKL